MMTCRQRRKKKPSDALALERRCARASVCECIDGACEQEEAADRERRKKAEEERKRTNASGHVSA